MTETDLYRIVATPPVQSRLILHEGFEVHFSVPRPHWWWRWWQWALLGWTWEKL